MKIIAKTNNEDIATVYIAEMPNGEPVEFVESVQPPIPREKKWVLIISTLYGCPVGCPFCDAGHYYRGKISRDDLIAQIDFLIANRFPDRKIPVPKFKIQFARMGEPAFNGNVLDVLAELPFLYDTPGLLPTLSTVAPAGTDNFFDRLLRIKKELYSEKFQLQFSIHSTDPEKRDWLIPIKKWNLAKIADYGGAFYEKGGRKITLNFALAKDVPVEPDILKQYFSPDKFLVKITPVNPTCRAYANGISSFIVPDIEDYELIDDLRARGYEVILSVGEAEENHIGSNCGQFITNYLSGNAPVEGGYTYAVERLND